MVDDGGLTELLTVREFRRIATAFGQPFSLGLETTGRDGRSVETLCSAESCPAFCRLVRGEAEGGRRCLAERQRAIEIAVETGQSFITICHAGIVLVCVPVVDRDKVYGGMFFGKCLWEPVTPMLIRDVESRLAGLDLDPRKVASALRALAVVQGRQIHNAAESLFGLLYEVGRFDAGTIRWRRQRSKQQWQ